MATGRVGWIDRLIWACLYGGLAILALGLATRAFDDALATTLIVAGAVLAVAGAVLLWVRSRLGDDAT